MENLWQIVYEMGMKGNVMKRKGESLWATLCLKRFVLGVSLFSVINPYCFDGTEAGEAVKCSLTQYKGNHYKLVAGKFSAVVEANGSRPELVKCVPVEPSELGLIAIEWDLGAAGTSTWVNEIELMVVENSADRPEPLFRKTVRTIQTPLDGTPPRTTMERKYSFHVVSNGQNPNKRRVYISLDHPSQRLKIYER